MNSVREQSMWGGVTAAISGSESRAALRFGRRAVFGQCVAVMCACRMSDRRVLSNLSYGEHARQKLDVYYAKDRGARPSALAILVHGGGWCSGSREDVVTHVAKLQLEGYTVVNVGYRLASDAVAPAAAEDVRRAIGFACENAPSWGASPENLILIGFSAGAHLAVLSALAPSSRIGGPRSSPRSIVSFWGIAELEELLAGPRARDFAQQWLPPSLGRRLLAESLSPMSYEVPGKPHFCAVHSVNDPVIPFDHSVRLLEKFRAAGCSTCLIKLTAAQHSVPQEQYSGIFDQVATFLRAQESKQP